MIDSDPVRYPKEMLQVWKQLAEQNAILEVEAVSPELSFDQDMEMINAIFGMRKDFDGLKIHKQK